MTFSFFYKNYLIKNWHKVFLLLVVVFFIFLIAEPIQLTSQDIGRHITNGRELINQNWSVLYKNHYSYTKPNHRFVNHHWLFGLFSFLIYQSFGFMGLHLVNMAFLVTVLLLLIKIITKESSIFIGLLLSVPAVLFLATRTEVRPESLGLLFLVHTLWQIGKIRKNQEITRAQLMLLSAQQVLWVNWHITFVFGIALNSLLLLTSLTFKQDALPKATIKKVTLLTLLLIAGSLLNPNHVWGLLQPFTIFTNYGYTIVENQNLLFLWRVIRKLTLWPYLFLVITSITLAIIFRDTVSNFKKSLLVLGIALGFLALRNIPIFVVFVFPVLAKLIKTGWQRLKSRIILEKPVQNKLILLFLWFSLLILPVATGQVTSTSISNRQLGLAPQQLEALNYVKQHNFKAPIFNNYDLGSYLIFGLYPNYSVFTDNRPEAYGDIFFQKKYIPMQQSSQVWQQQQHQYQFQTIIFGNNDITPWGQNFLVFIQNQPQWQLVFHNSYVNIYQLTTNYK